MRSWRTNCESCSSAQSGNIPPRVGIGPELCGDRGRDLHLGIAEDLEILMVVRREQRHHEERLGMVPKVGRHIADPQPSPGRAIVAVGRDRLRQRGGMPRVPAEVFLIDRLRIVPRRELQSIEQVAVGLHVIGLHLQRPPASGDRLIQVPLVLHRDAQVEVRLGDVGLDFQGPAVAGDRLFRLPLHLEEIAEVVMGLGKVGLDLQRPAEAGDRLVRIALLAQGIAQAAVGLGIIGD